jgi:hypothetical protein
MAVLEMNDKPTIVSPFLYGIIQASPYLQFCFPWFQVPVVKYDMKILNEKFQK